MLILVETLRGSSTSECFFCRRLFRHPARCARAYTDCRGMPYGRVCPECCEAARSNPEDLAAKLQDRINGYRDAACALERRLNDLNRRLRVVELVAPIEKANVTGRQIDEAEAAIEREGARRG